MADDRPNNERAARLPVTPTIPFPSKAESRATPTLQDTPGVQAVHQPVDAFKRADDRVPQPQAEGALGIVVAASAVIAILIAVGATYWWLRG